MNISPHIERHEKTMVSTKQCVMEGTLEQFPIKDVLDVLSISRQLMLLQLTIETFRAEILLKAGKVLEAKDSNGKKGREAAVGLLRRARKGEGEFRVLQLSSRPHPTTAPLGSMLEIASQRIKPVKVVEPARSKDADTRLVDTASIRQSLDIHKRLDHVTSKLDAFDTAPISERLDVLEASLVKLIKTSERPAQDDTSRALEDIDARLREIKRDISGQRDAIDALARSGGNSSESSTVLEFAREMVSQNKPGRAIAGAIVAILVVQLICLIVSVLVLAQLATT